MKLTRACVRPRRTGRCVFRHGTVSGIDFVRAMHRRSRPLDNEFAGGERLYARVKPNVMAFSNGEITANSFDWVHCPDQSLNRVKHGGRSWMVLMPVESEDESRSRDRLFKWGILSVYVSDLERTIAGRVGTVQFRVEHAPIDSNYHHCELHAFVGSERITKEESEAVRPPSVWRDVRKAFRTELLQAYRSGTIRVVEPPLM